MPLSSARRSGVIGVASTRRRAASRRANRRRVSQLAAAGTNRSSSRCSLLVMALIVSVSRSLKALHLLFRPPGLRHPFLSGTVDKKMGGTYVPQGQKRSSYSLTGLTNSLSFPIRCRVGSQRISSLLHQSPSQGRSPWRRSPVAALAGASRWEFDHHCVHYVVLGTDKDDVQHYRRSGITQRCKRLFQSLDSAAHPPHTASFKSESAICFGARFPICSSLGAGWNGGNRSSSSRLPRVFPHLVPLSSLRAASPISPPAPGRRPGLRCPRFRWPASSGLIRDPPRAREPRPVRSRPP